MDATVTGSTLYAAVKNVRRAVPTDSKLPILGNLRLDVDAERGTCTVSGTDLELALRVAVPCNEIHCSGSWTVPARQLADWLEIDPAASVTITRTIPDLPEVEPLPERTDDMDDYLWRQCQAAHTARVNARRDAVAYRARAVQFSQFSILRDGSAMRSRMTLIGMDAEDYPVLPSIDGAAYLGAVRADDLRQLIADTHGYAAKNDSRPIMAGLHFTALGYDGTRGDMLYAYATDGVRASFGAIPLDGGTADGVTVPARAMKNVLPLIKDCGKDSRVALYVSASGHQLIAEVDGVQIVSRVIDTRDSGAFPLAELRAIFAADRAAYITVKRTDMDKMLKRALALSADGDTPSSADRRAATVTFTSSADTLSATCSAGTDSIAASIDGAAIPEHMYYAKQIADAARTLADKTITLAFHDEHVLITSDTSSGSRVVMRVYSHVEQLRRDYRTRGAVCRWEPMRDGAHTRLLYSYGSGTPSAEEYARRIAEHAERYAEECKKLDTIMLDAWEGYTEPLATGTADAPTDAERRLLARAEEYHGVAAVDAADAATDADAAIVTARAEVEYMNGRRDTITFTDGIDAAAHCAALDGVASAEVDAPSGYPSVDDWRDTSGMLDVNGYHTAIIAYVERANADARAMYARAIADAEEPRRAVLLIAARSTDNRTAHPYGLPIPEDCTSADAIAHWHTYCAVRTMSTRIIDDPLCADSPRMYQFGARLAIHHYRRTILHNPENGHCYPYPEEYHIAATHRAADGAIVTAYSLFATLDAAYAAMLATIPGRAERPPGTPCKPYGVERAIPAPSAPSAADAATDANSPIVAEVDAAPSMFDTSDLPYLGAAMAEPLPDTMFTLSSTADNWRAHAERYATVAASICDAPLPEEPLPERHSRVLSVFRTIDGAWTVNG